LDFGFYIVDGVGGFDLEGDGLTRKGFDEDLHGSDGLNKSPGGFVSSAGGDVCVKRDSGGWRDLC
jgi:hypothetical protein